MHFCGLDVSLRQTAVCIVDGDGKIVKEAKVGSDPDVIAAFLSEAGYPLERIGLEAGSTAAPRAPAGARCCADGSMALPSMAAGRPRAAGLAGGLHRCPPRRRRVEGGLPEQERQERCSRHRADDAHELLPSGVGEVNGGPTLGRSVHSPQHDPRPADPARERHPMIGAADHLAVRRDHLAARPGALRGGSSRSRARTRCAGC